MSADEDTELRDLVAQTLETNGVLGKIRVSMQILLCNLLFTKLFYIACISIAGNKNL